MFDCLLPKVFLEVIDLDAKELTGLQTSLTCNGSKVHLLLAEHLSLHMEYEQIEATKKMS